MFIPNQFDNKGKIYSPMQEVSLGYGGWLKKSELMVEEGSMTTRATTGEAPIATTMLSLTMLKEGATTVGFQQKRNHQREEEQQQRRVLKHKQW